jgi:hypothetical protein
MNWKGCGICLEGLRKTTKNLSQDSRSPGRDLNPGPPEYEAGVLTTRPRRLVVHMKDSYDNKHLLMIHVQYGKYSWRICGD